MTVLELQHQLTIERWFEQTKIPGGPLKTKSLNFGAPKTADIREEAKKLFKFFLVCELRKKIILKEHCNENEVSKYIFKKLSLFKNWIYEK